MYQYPYTIALVTTRNDIKRRAALSLAVPFSRYTYRICFFNSLKELSVSIFSQQIKPNIIVYEAKRVEIRFLNLEAGHSEFLGIPCQIICRNQSMSEYLSSLSIFHRKAPNKIISYAYFFNNILDDLSPEKIPV